MNLADAIDAIPVVANAAERAVRFPAPQLGQRVHNLATNAIERWNGAWVTDFFGVSTGGIINVKTAPYNAVGDGVADDTAAIQTAITAAAVRGLSVYFPVGDYLCTSQITVPVGMALVGEGAPGAVSTGITQPQAKLLHNFNGDFFVCDGSGGSERGTGYLFRNLVLCQMFGSLGTAYGRAIRFTGTSLPSRPNWIRIVDCQIEQKTGSEGSWTWGVDIDGSAIGGGDGIRNVYITRSRFNQGTAGTGVIRLSSVFNAFISDFESSLGDGRITITGTAGSKSSNINFSNCSAGIIELDYAITVTWRGGGITAITGTANTGAYCDFNPGRVNNAIPITGAAPASNIRLFWFDDFDTAFKSNQNILLPNGKLFQSEKTGGAQINLVYCDIADHVMIDPGGAGAAFGEALKALGGGAAPTLGTIGGTGPAAAAQAGWLRLYDAAGVSFFIPAWR